MSKASIGSKMHLRQQLAINAGELADYYRGHWSQASKFPVWEWQRAVSMFETRLGYWEWVSDKVADSRSEVML